MLVDYGGETVIVESVALDDFLVDMNLPVHFIKVDVEGAEELVLLGAKRTIEAHHPTMVVELHHYSQPREKHPVLGFLKEFGYEFSWLTQWELTSHVLAM